MTDWHETLVERAARAIKEYRFGKQTTDELEAARIIATAAIERYGDFNTDDEWDRFRKNGIWNDHAAVQAALIAVRMTALDASGLREAVEALEKISAHVPLEQTYDDVLWHRMDIARATLARIKGEPND